MASAYSLVKTQAQWNILSTVIIATLLSAPIPAKIKPKNLLNVPLGPYPHHQCLYIYLWLTLLTVWP